MRGHESPTLAIMKGLIMVQPKVHLLCGLNGGGKTTYARSLPGVRFSLDEWMLRLYGLPFDDPDYGRLAEACKDVIWSAATQVLTCGVDVVLDWNSWSRERRRTWRARAAAAGYVAVVHYLDVPVEVAVARALSRADKGSHVLTEADVRHLAALFEPPTADEGMEIKIVMGLSG